MQSAGFKPGRIFLCRAKHGAELIKEILDFAAEKKIKTAIFTIIGATKDATITYYDQNTHKYHNITYNKHMEIAQGTGNLSFREGETFAHIHIVLSDRTGKTYAGHLIRATVFAAEIHLQEGIGENPVREYDKTTGLYLWEL